ncbi:cytochrome c3 family protein [Thermodesulfobacteriota bacterium B35]
MMRPAMVLLLFLAAAAWSLAPTAARADAGTCFSCHDRSAFSGPLVHAPVKRGRCGLCHNPHVARFQGLLRLRQDRLCYSCHRQQKEAFARGVVHEPVASGNCTGCHTPHAGSGKGLLREDLSGACFACHRDLAGKYRYTHQPYAKGECGRCHRPHRADNLQLLVEDGDRLCLGCHDGGDLAAGHRDFPAPPAGCLSCHNPHGSGRSALIRDELHPPYRQGCGGCHRPGGLTVARCLECHEDVQHQMMATHSHLTRRNGNSCLNCHSPHAGDTAALLRGPVRLLCVSCHLQTLNGYRQSSSKHPDIQDCSSCHEPHGSSHLALLKGDGIAVCVQCHEDQGRFTHPVGPGILDRQTGQVVTCVSCHNPMGTKYGYQLVRDGKKALCIVCHRAY